MKRMSLMHARKCVGNRLKELSRTCWVSLAYVTPNFPRSGSIHRKSYPVAPHRTPDVGDKGIDDSETCSNKETIIHLILW